MLGMEQIEVGAVLRSVGSGSLKAGLQYTRIPSGVSIGSLLSRRAETLALELCTDQLLPSYLLGWEVLPDQRHIIRLQRLDTD